MNLSAPFILRPIATTLLALGLAIAGMVAFNILPVAPLPQVDFPTIMVQGALPGASAEVMATSVATPLETQLGHIAGITQMTSASSLGSTRITLQFDLSRDIDGAARDVQAAINAASSQLPANLPSSPTYRKVNPADAPIMILSLTSDKYSTGQLYDAASTILQQKLSQVNGIGQVMVGGSSLPGVRVELNPTILNKLGIGLPDVANAITAANRHLAKGQIASDTQLSDIMLNDQLFKAREYAPLIITYRNNSPVRISDVADVTDSVEDLRNAGLSDGKPAVLLVLFKSPGANVINTIDQVSAILPQLKASIPADIDMTVMMDRTQTIRTSLHDVEATLVIAMLLVVIVSYLFLGNLRAMLIPGIAVPLSLIGTFGAMYLLGYSLDNLSLMALTIATGFVVDDAVVVLENITRHMEMGIPPLQAALEGAKEVGFTVLSMSLSLIAVFIPILLMGGLVGRLFREFSVTLAVAIFISMIVSLTVTPAMCARVLNTQHDENQHFFVRLLNRVKDRYERSLAWSLHHPKLMLALTIATIVFSIFLYVVVPKGFFPQQDTGRITGAIQSEQDISFQAMQKILADYVHIIQQDPAVQHVVGFVGGTTVSSGSIFITLKSLPERHRTSADSVINRLRSKLATVMGAKLFLQSAQDLLVGGRQGNAQFQYTLSADQLKVLNDITPIVKEQLAKLPGVADVNSDQRDRGLQVFVNIDHDTASRFSITSEQIDKTLYSAFGQEQVSTMYTPMNQYHVVMEVAPRYWQRPETLNDIYVLSSTGKAVPLSAFTTFAPSSTLLAVNHQGQAPAATLSFNLLPGVALGDAVNLVAQTVKKMHLPASIHGDFQGTAQAFKASLSSEPYLILAALFAVYVVLGMLYESLIHPITILSTLPSAGVGALLALLLTRTELSIIALIGIILLIGIVKKNAIMMIDFALHVERTENKTPREAIYQAALLRFRPIMMTTMAALFGALPLVFGIGLGSELRQPLGIAIVGGLIVSQMLTLYTTPVIYLMLERYSKWWQQKRKTDDAL
ncbi:MAG: multidrug efflux RND transporter permease subunit [Gammaproteobacteria bacterium]|nr:MAG: multidrug efflux RND transporter permease subunit [Gammaproteobacteria bacterium]